MTQKELTAELIKLAADVIRGEYSLDISDCRTIRHAREAERRFDKKRIMLMERIKRLSEYSRKLEVRDPETSNAER